MDKKTTEQGFYRVEKTNALINKDNSALVAYKKRRNAAKLVVSLEQKVSELEFKLNEFEKRILRLEGLKE